MASLPKTTAPNNVTGPSRKYVYEHLEQFFNLSSWDEDINSSFGLHPPPGDWGTFKRSIEELKNACGEGESIKVIYAARHGQGVHNTLSANLGIEEQHVHRDNGDPDPLLTDLGRTQATALALALQRETQERGMPMPQKWFVSPLKRCGETCGLEWGWAFGPGGASKGRSLDLGHGVPAVVVENIREHLHAHICDRRVPKSELMELFPSFVFPADMSEGDTLWQHGSVRDRETEEELTDRAGRGLEECLDLSEDATYISITSHSGALRGMTNFIGMGERRLTVGEMNVLVLKIKTDGER